MLLIHLVHRVLCSARCVNVSTTWGDIQYDFERERGREGGVRCVQSFHHLLTLEGEPWIHCTTTTTTGAERRGMRVSLIRARQDSFLLRCSTRWFLSRWRESIYTDRPTDRWPLSLLQWRNKKICPSRWITAATAAAAVEGQTEKTNKLFLFSFCCCWGARASGMSSIKTRTKSLRIFIFPTVG